MQHTMAHSLVRRLIDYRPAMTTPVLANLNNLLQEEQTWCSSSVIVRAFPDKNAKEDMEIDLVTLVSPNPPKATLPKLSNVSYVSFHQLFPRSA